MPSPSSPSSSWQRVLLRGLTFEPDGSVLIEYCIPAIDARQNGVVLNHTLYVPTGADYNDEIDAVQDAILALIGDVLEDLPNLEPMRPPQPSDEDDDDDDDDD